MRLLVNIAVSMLFVFAAGAELVDGVVATVDNEPILYSEVMIDVAPLIDTLQTQEEKEEALQQALDQAIERKLLYREAVLAGKKLPEEQSERIEARIDKAVEERMAAFKKQFDSPEAFNQALEESGENLSDFRENIRQQLLAIQMANDRRQEFEKEAVISESDVAQYFEDHRAEFAQQDRVLLRQIFLPAVTDEAGQARAMAQLETLRTELAQGADFAELATQYSEGPEAENGGLRGWIGRGELVPELEEAAFSLQPGEISPVIATDYGYQILRVDERVDAGTASMEDVRTQIEPMLRGQYGKERYRKWLEELRKRSRVRVFL